MEKAVVEGTRTLVLFIGFILSCSGAGAAGLAAVLQGLLPELKGKK